MKLQNYLSNLFQSTLGILVEIAYSFAIMLASVAVIYLVWMLKWSSGRI